MQVIGVQLDMQWEEVEANRRQVVDLLAEEDVPPGSLIVLPEMFEHGFSMNARKTSQESDPSSEEFLRNLAKQYDSAVLAGIVGPLDAKGVASNLAVAFAPDGAELVRYRKMQPFSLAGERESYGRGDSWKTFQWQGISIAPFICYDLRFPELFRPAAIAGAELIIVIACWPAVRSEHWVRLLQARAIENLAYTFGVNRTGNEPGLTFDGRSCAFDYLGRPLFEADPQPQVFGVDIDMEEARQWREKFPALRDIRFPIQIG